MTSNPFPEDARAGAKQSAKKAKFQQNEGKKRIVKKALGTHAPVPSNPNPEEKELKNEIIEHLHHINYPVEKLRKVWKELKPWWKE